MTSPDKDSSNDHIDSASRPSEGPLARSGSASSASAALLDMEKSLVDRIADIDDDRRQTSTRLRKAFQAHMDEVSLRFKGYRRTLIVLFILTSLLMMTLIWLWFSQSVEVKRLAQQSAMNSFIYAGLQTNQSDRRSMAELIRRVDEIERKLAQTTPQIDTEWPATSTQPSANALTRSIEALSMRVDAIEREFHSLDTSPVGDTGEIHDALPRDHFAGASIDTDVPERITSAREKPPATVPSAPEESSARQIPNDLPVAEISNPEIPDLDLQESRQRLEAKIAAARAQQDSNQSADQLPIDKLIDARLDRLENEYQRLLSQLDAPAVQSVRTSAAVSDDMNVEKLAPPVTGTAEQTQESAENIELDLTKIALQLIGFYDQNELLEFISAESMPSTVYVRRETYRGRPWFALIHSLYDNRQAATEAIAGLPDELSRLDIWLRQLPPGTTLERIELHKGN
jgi:DamX protein